MSDQPTDPRVATVMGLPLHRHLGLTLVDPTDSAAGTTFTVTKDLQGPGGWLHGGVIYALLDATAYLALIPRLPEDKAGVSHAVNISLMKGVPGDSVVRLNAEVLRVGKSLAFLRAEAHVGEHLVAAATLTKSLIPA